MTADSAVAAQRRSVPRAAVQIDPGELEDFQRAARLLLAQPLVTNRWPSAGALALVRRWELALGNEFARVLGYRVDVGRSCARLYRRSVESSTARGPQTSTGRPLGRWACSLLCLALAALEASGEQTSLSRLAEDILRLRSGDDALPVDLTQYDQRRALVDAVSWLADRGVISLRDGVAERWLRDEPEGDALYDIDRDTVSRLLVNSPSVLRDVHGIADFLADPVPSSTDGQQTRLRHRIARRLVTEPVLYYADLDDDELAYARWRRTRIIGDIERLTGAVIESRAEGWCLIDTTTEPMCPSPFPGRGTVAHAALLWGSELVAAAASRPVGDHGDAPTRGRAISADDADIAWDRVIASYGDRFSADYRERSDRLRLDVVALLEDLDLAWVDGDGAVTVGATLARYRPTVRLVDGGDQLSLLAGLDDQSVSS